MTPYYRQYGKAARLDQFVQSGASIGSVSMNHETERELPAPTMPLWRWDPAGVRSSFGTYRGLIRLVLAWLQYLTVRYPPFNRIPLEPLARVVFLFPASLF